MEVALGLIFFFGSLMFLGMIFGDRLSLFGNVDDRWLMTPFDLVTRFWEMLCEIFDRLFCFVSDHFWWVAATASGAVGIVLIAIIMFSGLTLEAAAVRRDELAIMQVGGVLDHTPLMSARETGPSLPQQKEDSTSHLVDQTPTLQHRFVIQEFREPEIEEIPLERPYVPVTETEVSYPPTPDPFRSRLRLSMVPFFEIQGQRVMNPPVGQMIQRTLYDLGRDGWQAFSELGFQDRLSPSRPDLPEDSIYDVDNLLRSVRILPGNEVATQALDVRKQIPENPPAGEFDIQILIRNQGPDTLSGLVVREQIPYSASAREMIPAGVYRDNTAVWVVDDLRPGDERQLILTVESSDGVRFESMTEVSAASAIRSTTTVEEARRPDPIRLPAVEEERPLRRPIRRPTIPEPRIEPEPEPIRLPDVRLRLLTDPVAGDVDEVIVVNFEVRNIGDADAEGVSLRVNLPKEVDHKDLDRRAILRRVESSVRVLKPQERRQMVLRIRPTQQGVHLVTAQLMLKDRELDIQSFDVQAGDLGPGENRIPRRSIDPSERTPRDPVPRDNRREDDFPSFDELMKPSPDPGFR